MSDLAPADVFIQWKGTNVCLDFHCYQCDTFSHFDGDFAYFLKCPTCGQHYGMPSVVSLLAVPDRNEPCTQVPDNDVSSARNAGWKPGPARSVVSYSGEDK